MSLPDKESISMEFPALPPITGLKQCKTVKDLLALNIRYCSHNLITVISVKLDGRWMCVYGYREAVKQKVVETKTQILIAEGKSKENVEPLAWKIDLCKYVKEYKDKIDFYDRQEIYRKKKAIEEKKKEKEEKSKKNLVIQ